MSNRYTTIRETTPILAGLLGEFRTVYVTDQRTGKFSTTTGTGSDSWGDLEARGIREVEKQYQEALEDGGETLMQEMMFEDWGFDELGEESLMPYDAMRAWKNS